MARININGFETGDTGELASTFGTAAVQGVKKRTGDYALRCNPTTTAAGAGQLRGFASNGSGSDMSVATMYCRFYFLYDTKPATGSEEIMAALQAGSTYKFSLRINSAGLIEAYDSASSLRDTGSTVLAAGTWYMIEAKVGTGVAADWEVKVNGTSEISGTSDLTAGNNGRLWLGKTTNRNGQTVDFFYDDVAVDDAEYPGEGSVVRMDPVGNGTYTAWTGTTGTFADVDDVPHDNDGTHITSSTGGDAETVTLESAAAAGISGVIKSVKACAWLRDEGGTSTARVRLRSGSTDADTAANYNASTTYVLIALLQNTDPATSAAWALAALDSIEVGVLINTSIATRCTAMYPMVEFSAAVAPNAPSDLTAVASGNEVTLDWTDNADNETGFRVQQSADGVSGWADIVTPAENDTHEQVSGLSYSTTYYFRVRAENATGNSDWSNTANATTEANPSASAQARYAMSSFGFGFGF